MEKIKGYIEHFIFHNDSNGYTVMNFVTEDDEITVTGNFPGAAEGEDLIIEGDFIEHPTYGTQFKMSSYTVTSPEDEEAVRRYLSSGAIKGIGPVIATRIVKKFKGDTFRIIEEEPERLSEIKGISKNLAMSIADQVNERRDLRAAMMYLSQFGLSNDLSVKIYNYYGTRLYNVIQKNPYALAEDIRGVGFKKADEIASKTGIAVDSDFRLRSGVLYSMSVAANNGNTCLPRSEVLRFSAGLLNVSEDDIAPIITNLAVEKKLKIKDDMVFLMSFYHMENTIAGLLLSMSDYSPIGDEEEFLNLLSEVEEEEGLILDPIQRDAVRKAEENTVSILTGGPGTGKTTTIRAVIRYFENRGLNVALCAPTGRAAKRMTEATERESSTIHRLLEVSGVPDDDISDGKSNTMFGRNEENPIEADVIIVDEVSMVDTPLFYALLKAVPEGCRLYLSGDVNQLPSVGPGNILKDLINSETFPVVTLEKIFRQAGESRITVNAHKIIKGEKIPIENSEDTDFFFQRRYDQNRIIEDTKRLVKERLPKFLGIDPSEVRVLTPMRKGPLGVEGLNPVLQDYLNPDEPGKKSVTSGGRIFREGDRVMQIKNDYQKEWEVRGIHDIVVEKGQGVFNGDTGIVTEVDEFSKTLTVTFDEGRCAFYPFNGLDDLELSYAVTIHKSQGSEFPAVVIPLLGGPRPLLNRNILYTAVTRAKRAVVIVGSENTFYEMIRNNTETVRYSGLLDILTDTIESPVPQDNDPIRKSPCGSSRPQVFPQDGYLR